MSEPVVTAIVPAAELTALGRRALERLVALGDRVEVLFVPDEPVEGLDARVTVLPSGPVPVGTKRQLALDRARGELVALVDDDAYPHPSWLDAVLAAFAADPGAAAVCGPTLTPPDDPPLEQAGGRVYASPLVAGPARWRYEPRAARDVDDAPSANLVIRREDALAVGMESPFHPGEDTVVCDRLVRRGRRIRYVPDAIVYHSRRPLWRPHARQVWRFGRRRGSFARRLGGNSRRLPYAAPSALVLGLGLGWLLPGRGRRLWRAGSLAYVAACVVAARDRDPRRWARVAAGIPVTHAAYGVGFLLGVAGVKLPEE